MIHFLESRLSLSRYRSIILFLMAAIFAMTPPSSLHAADVNVLIIGSTSDSGDSTTISGTLDPFSPIGIKSELQSIFSRVWGQQGITSTYNPNQALRDTVHTTVTNNLGGNHYSGSLQFQSPFLMLGDKRRKELVDHQGPPAESKFLASIN